jgi:hypothetical protein
VTVALTGFNALFIEPRGWLRYESPPLTAIPATVDQFADLDGQFALIGYDAPETARASDSMALTLYWQALKDVDTNYQVFVHLVDADGELVAQSDRLNPGDFPTKNWPTDRYVRDAHELALPAGLEPGSYRLRVGLWLAEEGERLPVVNSAGRTIGDSIELEKSLAVE